jgi:cyanophycin synthetase
MTTTDGIVIDGRLIKKGDMSGPRWPDGARNRWWTRLRGRFGICEAGLHRNDVAVVTNVTGDHLGLHGIDTLPQLAGVKAVLVDAVPRSGTAVLNADDPLVARMGRRSSGSVIYFTMQTEKGQPGFDKVDGHCGRGGPAMVLSRPDGGLLVLRGIRTVPLIYTTSSRPRSTAGRMNVANALAAALGVGRQAPRHPPGRTFSVLLVVGA